MKKILNKIRRRLLKRVTPLEYLRYVLMTHVDRSPIKMVRQEQNLRFFTPDRLHPRGVVLKVRITDNDRGYLSEIIMRQKTYDPTRYYTERGSDNSRKELETLKNSLIELTEQMKL